MSEIERVVAQALAEDLGDRGDITSDLIIPADLEATAQVVSRVDGVLAGRAAAEEVVRRCGLTAAWHRGDGERLAPGTVVADISGPARAVLRAERTLLNLMCHLSGIATLTAAYVDAAAPAMVLDTRKTTPGLRILEKA
ncbi:MAG: nicotinate-nucleotide diphosphorylase (carboxylating), partial [Miltoncostaeaceae bacterium]